METNIARVLLNTNDENKQKKSLPPFGRFDPAVMIDLFPGPALLVDGALDIKYQNIFANSLRGPLESNDVVLKSLIARCLSNNCPDSQKAAVHDSKGLRHYDLYAFPLQQNPKSTTPLVFLFGKETTIEHNLTNALVDSRQMFKDLVSCSTDFAWETDCSGNFIYVSPKGILGYTAFELNGKNSSELVIGNDGRNPFDTLDKINDMELWLTRADGALSCLQISAVPVMDNQGKWQGARGVCRDITHIRERESALRQSQKREHVLNKIVSTIRDMIIPADMLTAAIRATMDGIPSDYCCILQKTKFADGGFKAEVKQQLGALETADDIYTLCQNAMASWKNTAANRNNIVAFHLGRQKILMGVTGHHGVDNGAIILVRKADDDGQNTDGKNTGCQNTDWRNEDWPHDEKLLFEGVTAHLGIALEQAITHEELEKLAYTDELTALLNRRAFGKEVTRRIKHQTRSRKTAALLYLDLDNFKNVNDSKGHGLGDQILQDLARHLQQNTRVGDYTARLGGDEFVVWLEEISAQDAQLKARNIIRYGAHLAQLADISGPQLSISVGIAMSHPDGEQTVDSLIEDADKALYRAKSTGRAKYALHNSAGPAEAKKDPGDV